MRFIRSYTVRFRHCDPAGIVFYPRYFEMMNDLYEDWFSELGMDFGTMHLHGSGGAPTLKLEAEFPSPSRLGERLEFALELTTIGRSSFELEYTATCGDELRLKARATACFVARGGELKSVPIPADVRERMLPYLKGSGA